MPFNAFGIWEEPNYGGPPSPTSLPATQPIAQAGPGNQDAINAQTAWLNTTVYNKNKNNALDFDYKQDLANWELNNAIKPGQYGERPTAPKFTNVDYTQELNWLNSQTPGQSNYGQDVGYDLSPYTQNGQYNATLPQWTTANTHLSGPASLAIPNIGRTPTLGNPTGSMMGATGNPNPVGAGGQYFPQNMPPYMQSGNPAPNGGGRPVGSGTGTGAGTGGQAGGQAWWNNLSPTTGSGIGSGSGMPSFTPNNAGLGINTGGFQAPNFQGFGPNANMPGMPQFNGFAGFPGNGQPSVQNWTPPWAGMGGGPPIQGGGGYATGDNFLADQTNDVGYLRGVAEAAGYATDATPAWDAMVKSQQRNIDRQAADLAEKFNVMGGRFSTAFGDQMTDFYSQTAKDQNATLGQMTLQSQEAARQRELAAAGQLGQMSSQAAQQLSTQDFGSRNAMLDAALKSALQGAGGSDQAAALMAQLGASGASQLLNNSMIGAQSLHQTENTAGLNIANNSNNAAMQMFQAQQNMIPQMMQYDSQLRGLGNNAATSLSEQWQKSLGLGSQLGQQEFGIDDYNLNRVYEEWLRTQPIYNPLIPYLYSAATAQPAMYTPGFKPSAFSQVAGGIGALMGGAGAMGAHF